MPVFPVNPEIESMTRPAGTTRKSTRRCRSSRSARESQSMPAYRVNPEIAVDAGLPGQPGNRADRWPARVSPETSVAPDVLVITYKIFPAELLTAASGRIGVRRI